MGWLRSLVGEKVSKVMDTFSAVFSNPISAIEAVISPEKTIEEVTEEYMEQPTAEAVSETIFATLGYAGAIVGGAAVIGAAKAGALKTLATTVIKKIIPKTLKGKVVGALVVPAAAGLVITKPTIIEDVMGAPGVAFQAGTVAGEPSLSKGLQFVKDHPYMSVAALAAALAALGYSAVLIARILPSWKKDKAPPTLLPEIPTTTPEVLTTPSEQLIPEKALGEAETPILPETTTITTGKRPYKRRRAKKVPSVRQSVRINIMNKPIATGVRITNKRYISQELLA